MAQSGPAPKSPDDRRRTNAPARGEWVDITVKRLAEPTQPAITSKRGRGPGLWRWRSRKRWTEWTCDPASQFWSDGDVEFALDLLFIIEDEGISSKNLAVVMRGLDKLGLTPAGKRDLRYRITFTPYKEATKDGPPGDTNVIDFDQRRKDLGHGA